MNNFIFSGRLTRDPKVGSYDKNGEQKIYAKYTVAINRPGQTEEADFIDCVAFAHNAEFAEKYFAQGKKVLVQGRVQTGSYTNNEGQKIRTMSVIVSHNEYADAWPESNGATNKPGKNAPAASMDDFSDVPSDAYDDLPFR